MAADANAPKVTISVDGLEAKIMIMPPMIGEKAREYSPEDLRGYLVSSGVKYGFDEDELNALSANLVYGRDIVVARGLPPTDGVPGHYEYHFDTDVKKRPTIRPDGSTDYMNIKAIETVKKDEVIAEYFPAVQGSEGRTVRDTVIPPKISRDLPPMAGRGFNRSEDNRIYTSLMDGKIEFQGNRLIISPVYEIFQDADISTGNVEFNGDVVVHGGARGGVVIKASGNVTISGLVENCEIHAGKDLFLLSGVKGADKTFIECKGNITAQFIEYAKVLCYGDFTADYIFNCIVDCEGKLELTGKKSAIIGGYVAAIEGIDVNYVGNDFGTVTKVIAGISTERMSEMEKLRKKIETITDNIAKIKKGVEEFDRLGQERGVSYKEDPRRMQLLRIKIREEAVVIEEKSKLQRMEDLIECGKNATIRVFDTVFAGTTVGLDDHLASITDFQRHIEFVKTETGIRMDVLEGVVAARK